MYEVMKQQIECFENSIASPKLKKMFDNCFYDTLNHSISFIDKDNVYILTGDIPAMWLRDSCASVFQYLEFIKADKDVRQMILGLLNRCYFYISVDPYGNSFNKKPDYNGHKEDLGLRTPYTWERKFEIDSLCYPILLQYRAYKELGNDTSILTPAFIQTCKTILTVFQDEQHHKEKSKYYHFRPDEKEEFCIPNKGYGRDDPYTGMVWSGYRPSDDACKYSYFIPGNMLAVVILNDMVEMLNAINLKDDAKLASSLAKTIDDGINNYGITKNEVFGDIYAYETDGNGNFLLMDDANVPSLLAITSLGYVSSKPDVLENTRKACLSAVNPFYFQGKNLTGVGSPHTPKGYVWPMGVINQAMTSQSDEEKKKLLQMLLDTDDNTMHIHEGINKDDPKEYTRPWFTWGNSMFAYFLLNNKQIISKKGE
jgi:meiotically up-regulated gene 157 (Mug157) protein